ncbi:TPR repeat region-containing protein [Mycolicibacterium litorale]|uniref:ESX-1 secretion-associated protein EspA/EspE-like domain-containing protein n=1 Tax=Mycolicibacterium litorale TaxID=758802 RepID=A0AAD1ITD9_9MYCO|nr:EspA/EspE family type VII secretion system effector [Mycolicibacterium litorale]MCV7417953.1 hypothetical protein [Mycolicibacterium litorale]TDY06659.1 hypothetical protein BCL50_2984 [Mycolicibacterium litorale]BBY19192.1 hypothetical protein MLIT_47840 [Mycolicibacterium litorale]
MSALDGFYTTWDNARQTFGQGTPQSGTDFDKSPQLATLGSGVTAAAPGSKWSGAAAANYDKANTDHQKVFTQLAELDRKIAQQVDQSAQVVATGRQNLDQVKQWVTDAANSIPPGKQRDMFLMQIANKGLGQLTEVVQKTNAESNTVAQNIAKLGPEFEALARDQKFGNGEKDEKKDDKDDPEIQLVSNEEEMGPTPSDRQAEQDVQAALAGDEQAAGRVDEVLDSIEPGQPLTPEQGSYLSQMQAQQQGMSVDRLHEVEQKLGDHKDIIGDSWQLMSDPDTQFPKTETEVGALDDPSQPVKGGYDQLPRSVQEALNAPDSWQSDELEKIAGIVQDGDDKFQTNTEIDRGMLRKAADIMDSDAWRQGAEEYNLPDDQRPRYIDPVVSDVFNAVSPDHHAIHDAITNGDGHIEGIDPDKFMKGVTERIWDDNGEAAGNLFEWTRNTHGPEAQIAADTAEAYGRYLGVHGGELLDLPGHHTIGEVNPELVRAFGQGLEPYQAAMVGDAGLANGFDPLDRLGGDMPNTRNVFAVIDSDPDAAKHFNGQAYLKAAQYETSFASAAAENPVIEGTDPRSDDLRKAGRMLGLIDAGADIQTKADNVNERLSAYDQAKAAWELKSAAYDTVAANIPGGDRVAAALQDGFIGPEPNERDFPLGTGSTDVGPNGDQRDLGVAVTQAQYTIAAGMVDAPNADIPATYFHNNGAGPLMTPAEVRSLYGEEGWDDYSNKLQTYMSKYPSLIGASTDFQFSFGNITGIGPNEMPR